MSQQLTKALLYEKADELRAIATMGRTYAGNEHDLSRYDRVLDIALELVSQIDGRTFTDLKDEFLEDNWMHVSPLHGAEAVVVHQGKILLMQRSDNHLWCIPGGLVEVGETLAEAAVRELREEVGIDGKSSALLGIFDSRKWNSRLRSQMYHAIFLVECLDPQPRASVEAVQVGFFDRASLPPLSPGHDLRVPVVFELLDGTIPAPYFDP